MTYVPAYAKPQNAARNATFRRDPFGRVCHGIQDVRGDQCNAPGSTRPHRTRMLTDITPITRKENPGERREICREKRNPAGRRETAGSERRREGIELSGLRPVSGCPLIPCTVTGKSLNTPVFLCELSESRSLAGENPRWTIPCRAIPRRTISCQTIGNVILWRPAPGDSRRAAYPNDHAERGSARPYRAIFDRQSVPIGDNRR